MPFLARPHCDLYYEVHGAGPPLVFVHGLGGNHMTWWQQLAHFAPRHTCVSYAQRGFGSSREAAGGPGPAGFTDDLAALLDHLGLTRVVLIAQSMGGWPSVTLAAAQPERVRGLVLANTTGSVRDPALDAILTAHFAAAEASRLPPGVHPAAGARLAREQPAMHLLYCQLSDLSADIDRDRVQRMLWGELRATPVAALRVPLLAVLGEEDVVVPPASVRWLVEHVPGARLHVEREAGHSVYWERPAAFNAAVEGFLAGLR